MDDDIQQALQARRYEEAFALVAARYQDKVFRLAFSMLHNETQAEDLTQDVLLKVWNGLPGYRPVAAISTWIYTITRNTGLTELRKRASRPTVSLQEPEMEVAAERLPSLHAADANPGAQMDVQSLLAELPDKPRQLITLFYLEQKSYEEVAAMLGLPLGTVKTILFRAKKELLHIGARRGHVRTAARTETPQRLQAIPTPA
jgi:RNA polymerase sigma-70 factor (ECF subfamily)